MVRGEKVTDADIEREYWRVVDGGDLMLRVEYGNDLDVQVDTLCPTP